MSFQNKHSVSQKTIFITCFHALASRNIFNSDILKIFKKTHGLRIVIFVPLAKKNFFESFYSDQNVIIEGVNEQSLLFKSKINKFFQRLTSSMLPTYSILMRIKERFFLKKGIKSYLTFCFDYILFLLGHLKFIRFIVRKLDFLFMPKKILSEYIKKYAPSCIFASNIFSLEDTLFLMSAKFYKIFTIGMVRSWDQTTNKRILRVLPDKLIVVNNLVKGEVERYHDVTRKNIFVSGMPQFDLYKKYIDEFRGLSEEGRFQRKKSFFQKLGIDLDKKLILISPAGAVLTDIDWQILDIIKQGIKKGLLPHNLRFLVRNHPNRPANLSRFSDERFFIIENPGLVFKDNVSTAELDLAGIFHLCDSLNFCELVIQFSSSIGLDASIFDKPQIMIAFDGYEERQYLNSVQRYHDEVHMRYFISLNPATVVKNEQALFFWIKKYLKNPRINSDGRRRVREEILNNFDGRSGKNIAEFILKYI